MKINLGSLESKYLYSQTTGSCFYVESSLFDLPLFLAHSRLLIADCFLDYFSSVANDIGDITLLELNDEQLKSHPSVQRINEYKKVVNGAQFRFERLHCEEVTNALKELNLRKGMGHDKIPNSILRLGSEELAPSLTSIYNNCIDACCWPREWKKGNGPQYTRKTASMR